MAMIDYGAVVFKNGKCVNKDQFFMDMEEAVGWVDQPRLRYDDCDHLFCGRSSCHDCPRANYEVKDFGFGVVNSFVSDCRGNSKFERGLDGNHHAYIGDEHLTMCFYKKVATIVLDGKVVNAIWGSGDGKVSCRGRINEHEGVNGLLEWDVDYHIKYVGNGVYHFSMVYGGNSYHVIYGYGIDPDKKVWDRVKVEYLGKRVAKKVDRLYNRFGGFGVEGCK